MIVRWGRATLAVLVGELHLLRALWLVARRRVHTRSTDDVPLPYARGGATLALVLVAVSLAELVAVHLLVPWERWDLAEARWVVLAVSAYAVVWVLAWWASLHAYPHLATARSLVLRRGPWVVAELPWGVVEGATPVQRYTDPDDRHALGLPGQALTLDLDLSEPRRVRKAVTGRRGPEVSAFSLALDQADDAARVIGARRP